MIPLEVGAYVPASTGGVVVWQEVDGEPVDAAPLPAAPAVGLSVSLPWVRVRRARLVVDLFADGRHMDWDIDPALAATWGMTGVDFGWRWGPGQAEGTTDVCSQPAAKAPCVEYWYGFSGGPRVGYMRAPPWEPWIAWGLGHATTFGMVLGTGHVRPMLEARMGLDIVAEAVTGTLDTAKVDMGWTWTPMSLSASVRVGVAFR